MQYTEQKTLKVLPHFLTCTLSSLRSTCNLLINLPLSSFAVASRTCKLYKIRDDVWTRRRRNEGKCSTPTNWVVRGLHLHRVYMEYLQWYKSSANTMSAYPITTYRYDPSTKTFTTKTVDRKLGLNEVLIKTSHSGICYTDVHAKEKSCGLGHEGVGIIAAVGDGVKRKRIGDRVGWG